MRAARICCCAWNDKGSPWRIARVSFDSCWDRAAEFRSEIQTKRWRKTNMATAPYNLEIIDNCMTCSPKGAGFFRAPAGPLLKSLEEVEYTSSYPSDALLFV